MAKNSRCSRTVSSDQMTSCCGQTWDPGLGLGVSGLEFRAQGFEMVAVGRIRLMDVKRVSGFGFIAVLGSWGLGPEHLCSFSSDHVHKKL